ncbi:MAG: diguanylate cyclase [Gallionella sp.]|nr:diguanylate cyclase [Gallionella sp.]
MKLRTKFFILMVVIFLAFTATLWLYSSHLVARINEQWGARFAEKQVLFDKHRTLLPLMREVALARQMAAEPALRDLALHEENAATRKHALAVLERYRLNFQDHSYFAALAGSGHYYFNDAANKFAGQQLRYSLSPKNPDDAWFYATIAGNLDYQINVDPDTHLGNTKVWINVVLKHENKAVGVIGTGLDITQFIKESVDIEQPGIHTLFVDRDMAVQLYRDPKFIDFASITKSVEQRRKVDALLTDPADIEQLRKVMREVEHTADKVETLWVTFNGKKCLLGVAYLPEIGWFDLTLMDDDALRLLKRFDIIPLLAVMLLLALAAVAMMLHRLVLKPIHALGKSVEQIRQGHYEIEPPREGATEIAQFSAQFRNMAEVVRNNNRELEDKVALRTGQLLRELEERKRAEGELRIAAIAFESQDGMMVTDARHVILRVNHAFTDITGYSAEEAIGQTPRMLKSGHHHAAFYAAMWECIRCTGAWKGEIWNRRKNGEIYPEQLTVTAVKGDDGEVTHYVATLHDITARKKAEEEINNLAFYDTLTQLPNRRMLNDRLGQALIVSKRSGLYGALMFLDLDNFKPLNDTYGHGVGDLLLAEVARRLTGCVREADTVARFGGDEFVVMLGGLDSDKAESAAQAGIVAEKIRVALSEPYWLKFRHEGAAETTVEHRCAASIGVVVFDSESAAEDVLKWADMAMYQAKDSGRNSIRFY